MGNHRKVIDCNHVHGVGHRHAENVRSAGSVSKRHYHILTKNAGVNQINNIVRNNNRRRGNHLHTELSCQCPGDILLSGKPKFYKGFTEFLSAVRLTGLHSLFNLFGRYNVLGNKHIAQSSFLTIDFAGHQESLLHSIQ